MTQIARMVFLFFIRAIGEIRAYLRFRQMSVIQHHSLRSDLTGLVNAARTA